MSAAPQPAVERLIEQLADPDRSRARAALEALVARLHGSPALRASLAVALECGSPQQRLGAALVAARGRWADKRALEILAAGLALPDRDLAWAAGRALEALATELAEARQLLEREALASAAPAGRRTAIHALRRLHAAHPERLAALRPALDDPDAGVRRALLAALAARTPPATEWAGALRARRSREQDPGALRLLRLLLAPAGEAPGR